MRTKIGVFIIPKFQIDLAVGGAENICRLVTIGLSNNFNIIVFHGESDYNIELGIVKKHLDHIESVNAFYLDSYSKENGEISPDFCKEAMTMLGECRLLISFERVIKNLSIDQICVLGGISYKHCIDIAKSKIWRKLIVPSEFLKEKVIELSNREGSVQVISNGISCDNYFPAVLRKQYAALLPYRPDWGKGYRESIDFISLLNRELKDGKYRLIVTRQEKNDFNDTEFYEILDHYALEKNVKIEYVSWQNENGMNSLYNRCDFVLALGILEEGFGLTTIEAIASGRYVISRRKGATVSILPKDFGIIFIDEEINECEVKRAMEQYYISVAEKEVDHGIKYIKNNYDIRVMQKKYEEFISGFIEKIS